MRQPTLSMGSAPIPMQYAYLLGRSLRLVPIKIWTGTQRSLLHPRTGFGRSVADHTGHVQHQSTYWSCCCCHHYPCCHWLFHSAFESFGPIRTALSRMVLSWEDSQNETTIPERSPSPPFHMPWSLRVSPTLASYAF